MVRILLHWAVTALGVWVAAYLVPGISYGSIQALLIAALVLGILNAILKPLIMLFTLPLIFLTLGIFLLVINTFLVWLTAVLVPGFDVFGFWSAFFGGLIISIVSYVFYFAGVKK